MSRGEDDKEAQDLPRYRYRRSIEVMIETLKTAVIKLHCDAAALRGSDARMLREIADDFDDYAESLKQRLKKKPGL